MATSVTVTAEIELTCRVLLCKLNTTILSPSPADKRTVKPNLSQCRSYPTLDTVVAFHHVTLPLPVLPLHAARTVCTYEMCRISPEHSPNRYLNCEGSTAYYFSKPWSQMTSVMSFLVD